MEMGEVHKRCNRGSNNGQFKIQHFGGSASSANIMNYISVHFSEVTQKKTWKNTGFILDIKK